MLDAQFECYTHVLFRPPTVPGQDLNPGPLSALKQVKLLYSDIVSAKNKTHVIGQIKKSDKKPTILEWCSDVAVHNHESCR